MQSKAIEQIKNSTDLPVIMAPMFLISNPKMVINACASGIIGTFPALNARTGDILEDWMKEITLELEKRREEKPNSKIGRWGINFIVHRSNKRYKEDLKLIEKYQPPGVITSLGDPGPVVDVVHQYDGIVLSDVINIKFAKKAIETGEDILDAELLGADYAYFGTRFIPAEESGAQKEYKDMIIDSSIEDIIYTDAFSGVHANYLISSITLAGLDPTNLKKKEIIDFSKSKDGEVKAWKDVWGAGQGVGSITEIQTVSEIVEELKEDYYSAIKKVSEKNIPINNR